MRHLEQVTGEPDEIFEPKRLESQLSAQRLKLARDGIVEKIVAGDDGNGNGALVIIRSKAAQKAESVDHRHPEVQNDRIRVVRFSFSQPNFGAYCGLNLVTLEAKHARKRLRNPFIVIDNENFGGYRIRRNGGHRSIVTDDRLRSSETTGAELDKIVLRFDV